jgi:hypothetical protein
VIGHGVVINVVHGNNIGTQTSGQPNVGLMTQVVERPQPESPLYFEWSRPHSLIGEQVLGCTSGAHVFYSLQSDHAQQRGGGGETKIPRLCTEAKARLVSVIFTTVWM